MVTRRCHVAVIFEGEVISIPRAIGKKSNELHARLGSPEELRSVEEARTRISKGILPCIKVLIEEARARAKQETETLDLQRRGMAITHAKERAKLVTRQKQRHNKQFCERAERFRNACGALG